MQLNMLAGILGYIVMALGLAAILVCYTLYKRNSDY